MNINSKTFGKGIRGELWWFLFAVLFFQIAGLGVASAHNGEHHEMKNMHMKKSATEANVLVKINEEYLRAVKPIFQKSCFDCHGAVTDLPWYHNIPGAKQLMDNDIKESKVHLDMTKDFPFGGHGSPNEDLEAISEVLEKGTMPPSRYRILHWSSKVTPDERRQIEDWLKKAQKELSKIETKRQKE